MARKKVGIGVQNIQDFAIDNLIYVDKTEKIYELMQLGKHNFIVRPRRFGKSLLLDTIAAIYEGSKEQFQGTWVYDNIDWAAETRPTLRIDFTLIDTDTRSVEQGLSDYLRPIARKLDIDTTNLRSKGLFQQIIETLGQVLKRGIFMRKKIAGLLVVLGCIGLSGAWAVGRLVHRYGGLATVGAVVAVERWAGPSVWWRGRGEGFDEERVAWCGVGGMFAGAVAPGTGRESTDQIDLGEELQVIAGAHRTGLHEVLSGCVAEAGAHEDVEDVVYKRLGRSQPHVLMIRQRSGQVRVTAVMVLATVGKKVVRVGIAAGADDVVHGPSERIEAVPVEGVVDDRRHWS